MGSISRKHRYKGICTVIKKIYILSLLLSLLAATPSYAVSEVLMGVIDADPYSCGAPVTIVGLDTITRNITNQSYISSCGLVSWSISGTGATINSSGQVTTNGTACGGLTITATYSGGSVTKSIRVTDAGYWANIQTCFLTISGAGSGLIITETIEGSRKYRTYRRCHTTCGVIPLTWKDAGGNPCTPLVDYYDCTCLNYCSGYGCDDSIYTHGWFVVDVQAVDNWQCP